jgi:cobalt-zinc-cadmium efflux system membrane fusion protein
MRKMLFLYAALFASFVFYGCNKEQSEHEHEEEHEHEALSYTLYSEHTELFVEFPSLVVGEVASFAAHITVLGEVFKPLESGKVKVTLENNGSASVDAPDPPGIFRPVLKPIKTGENLKLIFEITTNDFIDTIVIKDISVYTDHETADKNHKHEEEGNEITYLKEQAWKVEFANQEVTEQTFFYTIRTTGQLITPPGEEANISAGSSGIVNYNGNYINGMKVFKGENLFNVSGTNINGENINTRVFEAKANYERAKADYERASLLIKDKIISEKEFLAIQNTYEIAEEIYNSLSKNYSSSGVRITTPISGFFKSINVKPGEFVEAGKTLAVVTQNKNLILKADLSQKYFNVINEIRSANFKTPDGVIYNTENLNGRAITPGISTGIDNLLLPINFQFDYRNDLIPGTFVEVFLKTSRIPNALVIPISALIEEQGVFYVYIQTGGESFEKREVTLAGSDGYSMQVLKGIEPGERVVTKGAYQIKLASASGVIPAHGHEH